MDDEQRDQYGAEKIIEASEPKKFEVKIKKKNPWVFVSAVLAFAVIIMLIFYFRGGITGGVISEGDAASTLVDYLNAQTGGGVEFVSSEDMGDLYKIMVSYQSDQIPVYITKDGEYFVQGAVPISGQVTQPTQEQPPVDVPKSDKPKVELFIMTHCPYGTQAEKGILPVYDLLGDKIDASIKFVHYFLHDPEEAETPIQICIREEQPDKYVDYLGCFLEDGDSDRCLKEAEINEKELNSCIDDNSEDYYVSDSALSQGYGVRGSPSLVINEQQVSSARSPAAYLATICSAFNNAPAECEEELSSANPSAGFGYDTSASASSGGSC